MSSLRSLRIQPRVYTLDAIEAFITMRCLKCGKSKPLAKFGLRRMGDGKLRNVPWCRACRATPRIRSRSPKVQPDSAGVVTVAKEEDGHSPVPAQERREAPNQRHEPPSSVSQAPADGCEEQPLLTGKQAPGVFSSSTGANEGDGHV